jgi:hypothetical protein
MDRLCKNSCIHRRTRQFYGGQWWAIVNDIPKDAYTTAGNRIVVVVPSHDLVIVRRGLIMAQGFNEWIWQGKYWNHSLLVIKLQMIKST